MSGADVAENVAASSLGVVCWLSDGVPHARGVVALVRQGRPALAFTYADEVLARDLAGAVHAVIALSERRSTGGAFRPMLLSGRPRLVEDPTGDVFTADLLLQELRKYPPSRVFADSPLLMREHWWYLPRLIVEIDVDETEPLDATDVDDHLLVGSTAPRPVVRAAHVEQRRGDVLDLQVRGEVPAGSAVVFGQDASFPDLEQWSQWRYRGRWDGACLHVEESPARTGLGPVPGLLGRWRRQRALERACVEAIPSP